MECNAPNTSVVCTMDMLPYFCDPCHVCREHIALFFVEPLRHVSQLELISSPESAN